MTSFMNSRLGFVIGAVGIVAISFAATLKVLDYRSAAERVTEETPASQLPKFGAPNIVWAAETGFNVQALNQALASPNQPPAPERGEYGGQGGRTVRAREGLKPAAPPGLLFPWEKR